MNDIAKKKTLIISIIIIVTFLFVLQEVLLRLVFPIPEVLNFNRINYSNVFITPGMNKMKYLSNTAFIWASEPDNAEFIINLNLYGFRDHTWQINGKAPVQRVMFMGDSMIEGFMAKDEETVPKGFEERAVDNGMDLEVLNLGVGASQVPLYFKLISDALPIFKPNHLVLVVYANDFPVPAFHPIWLNSDITPKYSYQFSPRLYYIIRNIINGNTVPHSWNRGPFPFISSVPHPSNPWSNKQYANYYSDFVTEEIAGAMIKGLFNPHVVDEYGKYKKFLCKTFDVEPHLSALKTFVKKNDAKLFILYLPSRSQVSNAYLPFQRKYSANKSVTSLMDDEYQIHASILKKTCKKLNIPFFDLTPILQSYEESEIRLFWNYDEHMNGKGNLLVGHSIFDWWEKQNR